MSYHIDTKCLREGYKAKNGESRALPIYQSITFKYDSAETMGNLFDLNEEGFFYTRIDNPTTAAVEKKIAALEGGVGALLTSSGQAAMICAVFNICTSGSHIISTNAIYGGTYNLFNKTLKDMGIEVTFIPTDADDATIEAAFRPNTKLVFGETLSNSLLKVLDIERFANAAHRHNVPLMVDNTFPTPINCRPFEFGADIAVHSTSKYMDGHAVVIGGAVVDSGNFDWAIGRYPELTQPFAPYHGIVYNEKFGNAAYIAKARTHLMRDFGFTMSPHSAYLLNLGLETLHLRMERHCANALAVAKYLKNHDKISWVNFPQLPDDKYYDLAQKYMPRGTCGVVPFGVKGGREAAIKFMEGLTLAEMAVHVADDKTCCLHPASTTHRQLTAAELEQAGVSEDFVRLSVGIEHIDDILSDIEESLKKL